MSWNYVFMFLCGVAVGGFVVWVLTRWWPVSRHNLTEPPVGASGIAEVSPDVLVMGDPEHPSIQIEAVDSPPAETSRPALPVGVTDPLIQLLEPATKALRLGREIGKKTMRVTFSREATRGLNAGTLEFTQHNTGRLLPMVRDAKSKQMREIGKAISKGGKVATVAAMGWQIAAVATAQNYLGGINEKLEKIEHGLGDVLFLLDNEKVSEIRAFLSVLRQYHEAVRRGQLRPEEHAAIYQKLEDLEHACLAIADLAAKMVRRNFEELHATPVEAWFHRHGESAVKAKQVIVDNGKAFQRIILAQFCRVVACQVKAALPGDRQLIRDRIENARLEVANFQQLLEEEKSRFEEKFKDLKKREDNWLALKGKFDRDYYAELNREYEAMQGKIEDDYRQLEEQLKNTLAFIGGCEELARSGMVLDLEVDGRGEVCVLSVAPQAHEV
jgi:hypothetical protein